MLQTPSLRELEGHTIHQRLMNILKDADTRDWSFKHLRHQEESTAINRVARMLLESTFSQG